MVVSLISHQNKDERYASYQSPEEFLSSAKSSQLFVENKNGMAPKLVAGKERFLVDEYNQITDHEGKIKIFKYDVYMMQYISLLNARTNFPLDSSTTPYSARAMKMRCVYQQFWHRRHNSTVEIAFGGGDDISCDAMLNTAASSIKGLLTHTHGMN